MKNVLVIAAGLACALLNQGQPAAAQARADQSLLQNSTFNAAFDMYWRARLHWRDAGNRTCSLENSKHDDPKSPFRPLDERFKLADTSFEKRYPRALNDFPRPFMMPPPQMLCSDAKAAWEAIFAFDTALTALEALLNDKVVKN